MSWGSWDLYGSPGSFSGIPGATWGFPGARDLLEVLESSRRPLGAPILQNLVFVVHVGSYESTIYVDSTILRQGGFAAWWHPHKGPADFVNMSKVTILSMAIGLFWESELGMVVLEPPVKFQNWNKLSN